MVIIQHDQIYITTAYTGLVSIGSSIHDKVGAGTSLGVVGNSSEIYFALRERYLQLTHSLGFKFI